MTGIVYKSTGSWYWVKTDENQWVRCRIKGKFRMQNIKNTNPIAVGDMVSFQRESEISESDGIITEIFPRKNYIIRKSVNLSKRTHIIASNIDYAFLMITQNNPPTYPAFIDRFLVTSQAYGIETILLFSKTDTYNEQEFLDAKYMAMMYRKIGYQCLGVSAKMGKNIEELKRLMQGKTCVISGHSGVGKSTLINALSPKLNLKTAMLSQQHQQGQHTTTFAQMFDLDFGGRIIDTPGIKGFGVVDIDKYEVADFFPEFFQLKSQCKFNNCLHIDEPHCAVKKALNDDEIWWSRYKSYLQIINGEDEPYRMDIYANSKNQKL